MRTKKQSPTRAPKRPPFAVGTRLKYTGTSEITGEDWHGGQKVTWKLIEPGMEVEIEAVSLGRKGTGQQLSDSDGPMFHDDGDPILDETRDGTSTYWVTDPIGNHHGRLIRHDVNINDWVVVRPAPSFESLRRRGLKAHVHATYSLAKGRPQWIVATVVHFTKSWIHFEVAEGHIRAYTAADIKRHVRRIP